MLYGFPPARLEDLFEPNNPSRLLRWAAPELIGQSGALSFGADIYALGMTILQSAQPAEDRKQSPEMCLTTTVHAMKSLLLFLEKSTPRPQNVIPPNSKDGNLLWQLLTCCWASNPLKRPSASEVLNVMKRITREGLNEIPGKLKELRVSFLSTNDLITRLGEHGCQNITEWLDMSSCSAYPLFGGGFGEVYRGKLQDGSQVAIKTMRVNSCNEAHKPLKDAARELHTWSKCQHPNVLKLLGLVEFRGQIGMVSAWMKKGSLPPYLDQNPEVDRCQMSTHICAGLSYLHKNQIIHGDLKGLNVLISDDGTPVLTDFGNAVLQDRTLQLTTTQDKNNISPRWTAPELMGESATYSFAADIYALAMVILETFTGKVPYAELTDHGVYVKLVLKKEAPKRPEEAIPSSSQHGNVLWGLLTSCWIGDPKGRPSVDYVWATASNDYSGSLLMANTLGLQMKLMTPEGLLTEQPAPLASPFAKTNKSSAGTPPAVTRAPLLETYSSDRHVGSAREGVPVPKRILNCLAVTRQRYPETRADVILKPKAASADGTPPPSEFPTKMSRLSRKETLTNFEVHMKNRIH
ncbi:kinase-like protein [Ceratobasidium sp. AG-I]|nr:kinase-like protein [Ceratobasidium sp. AG-I]